MKKLKLFTVGLLAITLQSQAFCGFYVAQADGKLFNKSSQVIIARNNDSKRNTITMANDYQGDLKEFAMVVPVPVVLQENDIKVVNKSMFERFDSYSAPRLAEYYDPNPCYQMIYEMEDANVMKSLAHSSSFSKKYKAEENKVTIEAQYEIGEYDILILSAKESDGLQNWLKINGYKIPEKATEVLEPYIKSNMKFFVAKVNINRLNQRRADYLSPIQISFTHKKFMLPIRLGMANANGTQDLIAYLFTKYGRVETANYPTKEIPSNINIPLFIKGHFGKFYKSVFSKTWTSNKSSSFLEYSWNLDGDNFTKCDPCSTTPPKAQELITAGVDWISTTGNRWGADYKGNLHFSRLHVRYDREHFPQDLVFTETRNKNNFQGRYILNHPSNISDETCEAVLTYYKKVQERRAEEIANLGKYTWWKTERYSAYTNKYQDKINYLEGANDDETNNNLLPAFPKSNFPPSLFVFIVGLTFLFCSVFFVFKSRKTIILN